MLHCTFLLFHEPSSYRPQACMACNLMFCSIENGGCQSSESHPLANSVPLARARRGRRKGSKLSFPRALYSHAPEHVSPMRGVLLRGASHEHFIPMRVALCRAGGSPCQRTSHCEDPTDAEQQLLTIVRRRVMTTWQFLSLIHISEPTRLGMISYAVFCLKKKKKE